LEAAETTAGWVVGDEASPTVILYLQLAEI
jgi:hypothetical protein